MVKTTGHPEGRVRSAFTSNSEMPDDRETCPDCGRGYYPSEKNKYSCPVCNRFSKDLKFTRNKEGKILFASDKKGNVYIRKGNKIHKMPTKQFIDEVVGIPGFVE